MTSIEELQDLTDGVNPFNRHEWTGRLIALDKASTEDFTINDVAEIVAQGADEQGRIAAVLRLHDGRYVTYETFSDVTGDGFVYDAYGGNADLHFATTLETAISLGLTSEGRALVGLS